MGNSFSLTKQQKPEKTVEEPFQIQLGGASNRFICLDPQIEKKIFFHSQGTQNFLVIEDSTQNVSPLSPLHHLHECKFLSAGSSTAEESDFVFASKSVLSNPLLLKCSTSKRGEIKPSFDQVDSPEVIEFYSPIHSQGVTEDPKHASDPKNASDDGKLNTNALMWTVPNTLIQNRPDEGAYPKENYKCHPNGKIQPRASTRRSTGIVINLDSSTSESEGVASSRSVYKKENLEKTKHSHHRKRKRENLSSAKNNENSSMLSPIPGTPLPIQCYKKPKSSITNYSLRTQRNQVDSLCSMPNTTRCNSRHNNWMQQQLVLILPQSGNVQSLSISSTKIAESKMESLLKPEYKLPSDVSFTQSNKSKRKLIPTDSKTSYRGSYNKRQSAEILFGIE